MIDNRENVLSLYIHVPFCVRKCLYCDFLSAPADDETREQYIKSLKREITEKSKKYKQYKVDSVFLGGGTPSVLTASQTWDIMQLIKEKFVLLEDAEITIEVNPGTADSNKLQIYFESGINRLSIGLQSADNRELEIIGRIHTYEDFLQIYHAARQVGFCNVNVDLMSGLPGQTMRSYQDTLQRVLRLHPEHISAYSLIIEEGTPFFDRYGQTPSISEKRQYPLLPDEDTERAMYELTNTLLCENGYHRYEISNYARDGYECRHNSGYWERHNYLGFGLGAASMIENRRWKNGSELSHYLKCLFDKENEQMLTKKEQMEEFMFLGLRLIKGVSSEVFARCFGVSLESVYGKQIAGLVEDRLLRYTEEGNLSLTKRGIDVSNIVMAEFLL